MLNIKTEQSIKLASICSILLLSLSSISTIKLEGRCCMFKERHWVMKNEQNIK